MFPSFDPDPITKLLQRLRQPQPADATQTPSHFPLPFPMQPQPTIGPAGPGPSGPQMPPTPQPLQPVDRSLMTGGIATDFNNKLQQIANSSGHFSGFSPLDVLPGTSQLRQGVQAANIAKENPMLGLALLAGALIPESSDAEALIAPGVDGIVDRLTEKNPLLKLAAAASSGATERAGEDAAEAKAGSAVARQEGRNILKSAQKMPNTMQKWAVLTAENPFGNSTPDDNPALVAQFKKELQRRGLPAIPVKGGYVDDKTGQLLRENSFYLPGVDPNTAEDLGRQFHQNSIVTNQGLHDLKSNMLIPSKGVVKASEKSPAFTIFPNGVGFAHNLDWNSQVPLLNEFEHYSPRSDLTKLDPSYMGTGMAGAERARANRPAMSHVYEAGAKPEDIFKGMPKYQGTARGALYDIAADPAGIVAAVRKKGLSGPPFADAMENALNKAGYAGYKNGDYYPDIWKLFGEQDLTPAVKRGKLPKRQKAR